MRRNDMNGNPENKNTEPASGGRTSFGRIHAVLLCAAILFLAALALCAALAVSNLELIRREGAKRVNLLGLALSVLVVGGYAGYILLGGGAYDTADMLGEILLGAAIGSIAGATLANLPAGGKRKARAASA